MDKKLGNVGPGCPLEGSNALTSPWPAIHAISNTWCASEVTPYGACAHVQVKFYYRP